MENIVNKIKAYAKANGVDTVDFLSDVVLEKPSDADIRIDVWNLDIPKPTFEQLNALETKATELQTAHDNEQKTKKNNKVSAYKKLDMTDDEILSIDPTLEEYL